MIDFGVDILEDQLLELDKGILETLLKDQTTGGNIIWATKDYEGKGEGYGFFDEITVEAITGNNSGTIRPRVSKVRENQRARSKDMAEVFTPSWICNSQNNLIDEAWFGEPNVFNTGNSDHTWESHDIQQNPLARARWHQYVADNRLEVTCGEAPYLVSRYDTTTGEPISIENRIGLFDRKMRVVNAFTPDVTDQMSSSQKKPIYKQWRRGAYKALQSTYGFEYQGDNLLLAREAMFISYIEYFRQKRRTPEALPSKSEMLTAAEIISWNLWQMDGLKYGIPGYEPKEIFQQEGFLFIEPLSTPRERYCRIREWKGTDPITSDTIVFKALLNDRTFKL